MESNQSKPTINPTIKQVKPIINDKSEHKLSDILNNWQKSVWKRPKERVGKGLGSGTGRRSCRGEKGQKGTNTGPRPGFEGGQTPVYKRIPKRGGQFGYLKSKKLTFVLNAKDVIEKLTDTITIDSLCDTFRVPFYYKNIKIIGPGKEKYPDFLKPIQIPRKHQLNKKPSNNISS